MPSSFITSTIASRIANEFNEADGLQLSALMGLGCILFVVTFAVLIAARWPHFGNMAFVLMAVVNPLSRRLE